VTDSSSTARTTLAWRTPKQARPRRHSPQLRFYAQNARPGAAGSGDARQILEARFVIAQMLAAEGEPAEALAELRAVRPLLVEAYGEQSTLVRNLDKQSGRFSMDPALEG
jgi:hypothetical protein